MAKLLQTVLVFGVVAIALCNGTPGKLDKIRTAKNRFLARQEAAAEEDIPAQTPYPPAGIRPEVPFDLPTEEKLLAPANHYLPPLTDPAMFYSAPAEVYGPPAETYGPPAETYGPPAESYCPPEVSDEDANGKSVPEVPENNSDEETQTEASQTEEAITEEIDSAEQPGEEQQEPIEDASSETSQSEEDNFIPERLVLAKSANTIKAAKLKQLAPLTAKTNKPQQFYLINGSLYTVA